MNATTAVYAFCSEHKIRVETFDRLYRAFVSETGDLYYKLTDAERETFERLYDELYTFDMHTDRAAMLFVYLVVLPQRENPSLKQVINVYNNREAAEQHAATYNQIAANHGYTGIEYQVESHLLCERF